MSSVIRSPSSLKRITSLIFTKSPRQASALVLRVSTNSCKCVLHVHVGFTSDAKNRLPQPQMHSRGHATAAPPRSSLPSETPFPCRLSEVFHDVVDVDAVVYRLWWMSSFSPVASCLMLQPARENVTVCSLATMMGTGASGLLAFVTCKVHQTLCHLVS